MLARLEADVAIMSADDAGGSIGRRMRQPLDAAPGMVRREARRLFPHIVSGMARLGTSSNGYGLRGRVVRRADLRLSHSRRARSLPIPACHRMTRAGFLPHCPATTSLAHDFEGWARRAWALLRSSCSAARRLLPHRGGPSDLNRPREPPRPCCGCTRRYGTLPESCFG